MDPISLIAMAVVSLLGVAYQAGVGIWGQTIQKKVNAIAKQINNEMQKDNDQYQAFLNTLQTRDSSLISDYLMQHSAVARGKIQQLRSQVQQQSKAATTKHTTRQNDLRNQLSDIQTATQTAGQSISGNIYANEQLKKAQANLVNAGAITKEGQK